VAGWLAGCSNGFMRPDGWVAGWLPGWLGCWLPGWLGYWLPGWLLAARLAGGGFLEEASTAWLNIAKNLHFPSPGSRKYSAKCHI
jgi:hypothetical protein